MQQSTQEWLDHQRSPAPRAPPAIDRLTSIPRVGITLATKALCEVLERGNIEFSKLTSLVDLAPCARDSGKYKGKRSIFAGRGGFRRVLLRMLRLLKILSVLILKCFELIA